MIMPTLEVLQNKQNKAKQTSLEWLIVEGQGKLPDEIGRKSSTLLSPKIQ